MNLKVSQKNPSFVLSFFFGRNREFLAPYEFTIFEYSIALDFEVVGLPGTLDPTCQVETHKTVEVTRKKVESEPPENFCPTQADASLLAQNSWTFLKGLMLRKKMELQILSRIIDEGTETFAKIERLFQLRHKKLPSCRCAPGWPKHHHQATAAIKFEGLQERQGHLCLGRRSEK